MLNTGSEFIFSNDRAYSLTACTNEERWQLRKASIVFLLTNVGQSPQTIKHFENRTQKSLREKVLPSIESFCKQPIQWVMPFYRHCKVYSLFTTVLTVVNVGGERRFKISQCQFFVTRSYASDDYTIKCFMKIPDHW